MQMRDRYFEQTRQKLLEEIDPTDRAAQIFVNDAGYTIGFRIQRETGHNLEYDTAGSQFRTCSQKETLLDLQPEDRSIAIPTTRPDAIKALAELKQAIDGIGRAGDRPRLDQLLSSATRRSQDSANAPQTSREQGAR